ncbi:DUF6887 family protein [Nostoc sp.]|uniref:DUF6887 family protein n=1 Tax=Nostoc sp. TaxID=1180 RepID=UPI003FA55855
MSQPNFDAMSEAELRTYVLEHRDDQEAFYAFADRLTAKPPSAIYPASIDLLQKSLNHPSPTLPVCIGEGARFQVSPLYKGGLFDLCKRSNDSRGNPQGNIRHYPTERG